MRVTFLILLKSQKDKSFLHLLKRLQESRSITYRELRKEIARSTLARLLRNLEIINQEVGKQTGTFLFVKEKKQLGKYKFENVLRIRSELQFIEAGTLTLVKCYA